MDSALDQIAAKCGSQLRAYRNLPPALPSILPRRDIDAWLENCVAANRGDWGKKCQVERQALSDCSEEK